MVIPDHSRKEGLSPRSVKAKTAAWFKSSEHFVEYSVQQNTRILNHAVFLLWQSAPTLQHQWVFLHGFDLFFEHLYLTLPVVAGAKPGKVDGKDGVMPTLGQPSAVVDQA